MNWKIIGSKIKNIKHKGFTLTELLLYMGLLTILISLLSVVFSQIVQVQLESESTSSVDLDGRYILAKLIYDMHSMQTNTPTNDTIIQPATLGSPTATLTFTVNSINYTYSSNSGNLQLVNDKGTNNLNSVNTIVSGLQFTRIGQGTSTDTIRVNFKLTSTIKRNTGPETRTFQTTIGSQ